MSASLEVEGLDRIISRLEQMGRAGSRIQGTALKTGGNLILDTARGNLEAHGNIRTGELRDGLKVSNIKSKNKRKYVEIGITKSDNSNIFYGKFLEWGTSKMAARPFLIPAFEARKMEAKTLMMQELRRSLGL